MEEESGGGDRGGGAPCATVIADSLLRPAALEQVVVVQLPLHTRSLPRSAAALTRLLLSPVGVPLLLSPVGVPLLLSPVGVPLLPLRIVLRMRLQCGVLIGALVGALVGGVLELGWSSAERQLARVGGLQRVSRRVVRRQGWGRAVVGAPGTQLVAEVAEGERRRIRLAPAGGPALEGAAAPAAGSCSGRRQRGERPCVGAKRGALLLWRRRGGAALPAGLLPGGRGPGRRCAAAGVGVVQGSSGSPRGCQLAHSRLARRCGRGRSDAWLGRPG